MSTATVQTSAQPSIRKRLDDGEALGPQRRFLSLRSQDAPALDVEKRTLVLTFSSELPVERWFGMEILSHAAGAADLSRLNDGAPLLFNHNPADVIGVVESAHIGADMRGHAVVRFAKTARGDEMMGMVEDNILRNVSFMYDPEYYVLETDSPNGYSNDDTYTAPRWLAYEISLVTIPADPTVGVGRSTAGADARNVRVETRVRNAEVTSTTTTTTTTTTAPAIIVEEDSMKKKHILMNAAGDNAAPGGSGAPTVIHLTQDQMRIAERERQTAIRALGDKWKNPDLAMLLVEGGTSIEGARSAFLEALEKDPVKQTPAAGARVDMSEKEKRSYSMLRGMQALHSKEWKTAGFEREVSNEIARQLGRNPSAEGMFLPSDLPFAPDQAHQRAFSLISGQSRMNQQMRSAFAVGAPATGGNLVATELLSDSFIEVLRNAMVTPQLGARFLSGLVGNVDIPRQISAAQTSWVGELTAGTESEATFDKVQLRPKNLTSWGIISRMMMMQATPAIEMLARVDLIAQMALALDLAAISGNGAGGAPTGIVNQAGVLSVVGGANGKNVDFDDIIKLYTAPRVANASQNSMAFAMNSKVIGYLASLKATTGTYLWDPQGGLTAGSPDRIKGKPYGESQQLRSTLTKGTSVGVCSEIVYGNWLELLIAEWGAIEVAINPYDSTLFKSGDVVLRAIQTADIGVRHGASFSVMSDALTPGF